MRCSVSIMNNSEEAGASFVRHLLWPLLQMRHLCSDDLQRLLTWAVSLRVVRWPCHDLLIFLRSVLQAVHAGQPPGIANASPSSEPFRQQLQSHMALATAIIDACESKRSPHMIQQMVVELSRVDWMDQNVRCNASIRLIHSSLSMKGFHLELDKWEALLALYARTSCLPNLLQLVLQSLRTAMFLLHVVGFASENAICSGAISKIFIGCWCDAQWPFRRRPWEWSVVFDALIALAFV